MKELKEFTSATIDLVACFSIWLVKAIALFIHLAKLSYQLGQNIGNYRKKTTAKKELLLLPSVISPEPLPKSSEQPAENNSPSQTECKQSTAKKELLLLPSVISPNPLPKSSEQPAENNSPSQTECKQSTAKKELLLLPSVISPNPLPKSSEQPTENNSPSQNATKKNYQQWEQLAINELRKLCKEKGLKPMRWTKQQCIDQLQSLANT